MSDVNDAAADTAEPIEQNENEEGQEQTETPAAPVKNLRKYKYKADGQDYEDEIDLNDEKAMTKHLSMGKAAYKRMEEAAKVKSQAERFIKMLQEDPEKVLTHEQFGGSKKFREIAERFLVSQLESELLSPEERQRKANEDRLRKYEEQEKTQKQQQETEQMTKLQEHYAQDFQTKIVAGLSSQGIPKTARTVKRMAELMSKNLQHGLDLSPEHLAEIVKQDYVNEMREMFAASEGDVLLKLLGDDIGTKVGKAQLARLRNGQFAPAGSAPKSREGAAPKEEKQPMTKEEWRAWTEKNSKS